MADRTFELNLFVDKRTPMCIISSLEAFAALSKEERLYGICVKRRFMGHAYFWSKHAGIRGHILYRAARGDWEKLANTVKVNSESLDWLCVHVLYKCWKPPSKQLKPLFTGKWRGFAVWARILFMEAAESISIFKYSPSGQCVQIPRRRQLCERVLTIVITVVVVPRFPEELRSRIPFQRYGFSRSA